LVGEVAISFQNARLYEQLKARTVALESEIAERQQAEAALRESEERDRLITEMTTDYIFIVDVAPAGLLKLRWASESMTRMTGRTIAEAATSDLWASIIHPEDARSFFGFIQEMLTGALPGMIECRSFNKAGEERWIQINAYPRGDANGVVVSIVGAIKDITERKQAKKPCGSAWKNIACCLKPCRWASLSPMNTARLSKPTALPSVSWAYPARNIANAVSLPQTGASSARMESLCG
jgi:PAS domain S-box-containing protein